MPTQNDEKKKATQDHKRRERHYPAFLRERVAGRPVGFLAVFLRGQTCLFSRRVLECHEKQYEREIMTLFIRPIRKKEDDAVWQMFQDIPANENNTENHANGTNRIEFDEFCKNNVCYAQKAPKGKILQITYIIFDNDVPVGFGKFRPFLNKECIEKRVSQFAYMISPKHRGKGYANGFLTFLKKEAQKLGLNKIEGGVLEENSISQHIIEKNGGKIKEHINGRIIYTIALPNKMR